MKIGLSPLRISLALAVLVIGLAIAHLITQYANFYLDKNYVFGVGLFDLEGEKNIPSLYSSIALFFCFVILLIIAKSETINLQKPGHWRFLGFIFLFLSFDEYFQLHERFQDPVRSIIGKTYFFNFEWVVPYFILLAIACIFFFNFIRILPKRTAIEFILSSFIFLLGAVGFEALGTFHYNISGEIRDFTYAIYVMVEEFFEMIGVVGFIYTFSDYISSNNPGLSITIQFLK